MKEKIKSAILLLLVINSLVLTWFLIYDSPNNSSVSLSEYLPRIKFGQESELVQVIKPIKIISHFGENKHSISFPAMESFKKIEADMDHWFFHDFNMIYYGIDWKKMLEEKKGIELVFPDSLSNSLLSSFIKMSSTNLNIESVNRLWLTADDEDNVHAYFISEKKDQVIVSQTSISSQKLNQYLSYTKSQSKYSSYWVEQQKNLFVKQMYYLPIDGIDMKWYLKSYTPVSIVDFTQLLFIDPLVVRKIYEVENNENVIYTDGTRSMQYFFDEKYVSFYQPATGDQTEFDLKKEAYTAVRFVNQHGGWDGTYYLKEIKRTEGNNQTLFQFLYFLDGFPLLHQEGNYGIIEIQLQDGAITQFQRSTLLLDTIIEKRQIKTMNEEELLNQLDQKEVKKEQIQSVELGYQMAVIQEGMAFYPYWRIQLIDGTVIEIPHDESVVTSHGLE